VSITAEVQYKNTWFGKVTNIPIFKPFTRPYKGKSWRCPILKRILITVTPRGGFGQKYVEGGDKCAVWNGEEEKGGYHSPQASTLRYKPQVFFFGGNRGSSYPVLWEYGGALAGYTQRELVADYPIREGDTAITESDNILDQTKNDELGGCASCSVETGQLIKEGSANSSTLTITY
jgi:hypothetical protein